MRQVERQLRPHSLGAVDVEVDPAARRRVRVGGRGRAVHLFWAQGLPRPELQWEIYLPDD